MLLSTLACGLLTGNAYANNLQTSAALTYCNTLIPGDGTAFVQPIVNCFTDSDQGIIPSFAQAFMQSSQTYFMPAVQAMVTLLVVIFGLQLVTGHVRQVKETTFTLLFKVAGVFYFMNNAPTLYQDGLSILDSLIATIATAATSASSSLGGSGCVAAANLGAGGGGSTSDISTISSLWSIWDCIFGALFGFTSNHIPGAIGAFLFLIALSKGVGTLTTTLAFYFLSTLFFSVLRFIHIYIIAVLAFSFMFCVGYIFVPLILFKGSADYFVRWLNQLLGLILTPVIALGYMAMMLVALDVALFTGTTSIWGAISGSSGSSGSSSTDALGQATGTSNITDNFWHILNIDHQNSSSPAGNGSNTGGTNGNGSNSANNGGTNGTSCAALGNTNTQTNTNAGTGTPASQDAGLAGTVRNENQLGSALENNPPPGSAPIGFDFEGLKNPCANSNNYNLNLLVSFAGGSLLIYVMYSLLGFIPSLAGNLVAQGNMGLEQMFGNKGVVPGQSSVNKVIQAASNAGKK